MDCEWTVSGTGVWDRGYKGVHACSGEIGCWEIKLVAVLAISVNPTVVSTILSTSVLY